MSQGRELGRMLMSKDPLGQVKHGITLPRKEDLKGTLKKGNHCFGIVPEEERGT